LGTGRSHILLIAKECTQGETEFALRNGNSKIKWAPGFKRPYLKDI
jgi:hypothetical protein